ncbi:hypothetical protein B4143_3345 [Bacillus subtilis]|nr:Hypothetical Protein U712_20125 [Bacillus subtilis PY79]AKN11937.1 hypothetical protein ABU16_0861 [Bacillus subtilis]EME08967.1 hypothetical protein BS732_0961 [Bacillus subtilis MB73/2]KAF1339634.1 hypothetical protein ABP1_0217 [Bacillus subtilis]KIO57335.1 hypothetical protein B4143_3345 [Bacillus subtilis]
MNVSYFCFLNHFLSEINYLYFIGFMAHFVRFCFKISYLGIYRTKKQPSPLEKAVFFLCEQLINK